MVRDFRGGLEGVKLVAVYSLGEALQLTFVVWETRSMAVVISSEPMLCKYKDERLRTRKNCPWKDTPLLSVPHCLSWDPAR